MKNLLFPFLFVLTNFSICAQIISTNTISSIFGIGNNNTSTIINTTTTQNNSTYNRNTNSNDYTFSSSASGSTINNTVNNNGYYNNSYGNNGYNYGYNNNYSNNSYNNINNNQEGYLSNNDGYGSTVEMEDKDGKRIIVETTTDSTVAEANKSIKEKINSHIVHFTGLVMSDNFNEGNLSKAYVMDKYSEFIKPGKYNNISASLPNSVQYTFDGIAVPPKTRLVIYSGPNYTGNKLLDVTGPVIINNNKWEFDNRYTSANTKTYSPDLQNTFPQTTRQWSKTSMHDWHNGSIEITEVP